LIIKNYTIKKRETNVDISQNLFLFLILYLFYNANLLKQCNDIRLRINVINFVNNVNILTYKELTKRNYRMLAQIYNKCEQWIRTYNFKFAKKKYKLIYFLRISKKFNISVNITLIKYKRFIKFNIKVLEIWLNLKLRWKAYLEQIKTKLVIKHKEISIIESLVFNTFINVKNANTSR